MTTATSPATETVARELVELCRAGRNSDAIETLYSPAIESNEPMDFDGMPARATGIDAIRRKNEWWNDNYEVDRHDVDGPYVNGDQFSVRYTFATTHRKTRERSTMSEIAVYTVKDGKIVQEKFFNAVSDT